MNETIKATRNNNLGEVLGARRKEMKLTRVQVAFMSRVAVSHLGRIEQGVRFPSALVLRQLALPLDFGEIELFKLAGFLSRDATDDRLDRFKKDIKKEISGALVALDKLVDSF